MSWKKEHISERRGAIINHYQCKSMVRSKIVIQILTNRQLEDDAGDSTEVQPTNDLDELVLDFVNGLEACLSASSMNGSGISSSPATQALTQALTHCNCHPKYASAAPLAPGEFWYTRAMLDIVGHGQLARDLILSLVVETSYGGRGLRISQDSGASASFISRKMAESLEAKIEPLDPERPVAGPKDHALADMMVAFHTAMLKLRLPCRPGEFQVTFLMVDNLRPGIQAYLSAADASSLGHILILHCERCARAM